MVGHTRRFNPSHQWIHRRIGAGELSIQQMDVQTYFFRRTNMNAPGQPRSWTDHLLWHHAAHTVDLFQYQTGEDVADRPRRAGADPPRARHRDGHVDPAAHPGGPICTLSLSFNNDGPLGTFFRYICDNGTYIARYDDLVTGREEPVDVSQGGRLDQRHRAAGPRVRRGDPRGPRAELERGRGDALLPGAPRARGGAGRGRLAAPAPDHRSATAPPSHPVLTPGAKDPQVRPLTHSVASRPGPAGRNRRHDATGRRRRASNQA